VIVVSGITNKETKEHALELGAEGYITKPFDLNAMVDMVKSVSGKN